MFENTGKKLKGLAVGTFVLHIIASLIGGICMMVEDDDLILAGIGVIAVGIIIGYIISLIIAAFGELVCSATASEYYLEELKNKVNKNTVTDYACSSNLNQEKIPAWKRVQMEGEK